MHIVITAVLGFFSSLAGRFVTDSVAKYVAYKLFFYTLVTVTVPIVAKNLIVFLFTEMSTIIQGQLSGLDHGATMVQLTGVAGYLAEHLMLPDCLALLLTAVAIRFTLNMIPFVG